MRKKGIDNQVGDEGVEAISESLKNNSSLTSLNLWSDEMKMIEESENE